MEETDLAKKLISKLSLELEAVRNKDVTRLEVIDHATGKGRVLVMNPGSFRELQFSYQDEGRTLKVFLV
jgi:hypothetical protein